MVKRNIVFENIENATPLIDSSDLIPDWIQNQEMLNRVETENIAKAKRRYLLASDSVSEWFHIRELRAIHLAMFGDVWKWAGKYRKSDTSIGTSPGQIPNRLAEVCEEVIAWTTGPRYFPPLEEAVRIHHKLVLIHPFENGNGRFSRLIGDRWLLDHDCTLPSWPIDLHLPGSPRKKYIEALQEADHGNYVPLLKYMKSLGAKEKASIS